jgi:transposase
MPRTRPPYPAEFKMEAVRLLRAKARTPRQLAVELGCSEQTLRNWLRQDELDRGVREDGLTTEERAELVRLRRENRVLQQEKEILRKAAVFFARETDQR